MRIKCICCLEEKEEYLLEICKECSDKIDDHILTQIEMKNEI